MYQLAHAYTRTNHVVRVPVGCGVWVCYLVNVAQHHFAGTTWRTSSSASTNGLPTRKQRAMTNKHVT